MKKEKGITLIALAITIVVLLILAGVTIAGITGENGIIRNAKEAKVQSEIGAEKEIIDVSVVQAIGDNKRGNLEKIEYENRLKKNSKKEPTNVFEDGEFLITEFINKNRFYQVDKEGNVEGPIEKIDDEFAGDITKGGSCDGTPEKPYEVNCIEDLVAFSKNVNEGNNYKDKDVILTRTLDFNSIFSYSDSKSMKYGDLNTNGVIEDIRTELTNKTEGCIGFTPIGKQWDNFDGIFDGKNNEILNIYIKRDDMAALFVWGDGIFKNFTLTGDIQSNKRSAAGIVEWGGKLVENCVNKANITGCIETASVGGITTNPGIEINNCVNYGNITGKYYTGGISSGHGNETTTIRNCINFGKVDAGNTGRAGGILGVNGDIIENCVNLGELSSGAYVSGICGTLANQVKNCANLGKINKLTSYTGSICYNVKNPLINCYYNSSLLPAGVKLEQGTLVDVKGKSMQEVVDMLNSYRDETGKYPEGWRRWKIGENGYPAFE